MFEAAIEMFEQRVNALLDFRKAKRYGAAFVLATVEATTSTQYLRTTTALCAAVAAHPEVLEPYAKPSRGWHIRLEQAGTSPAQATVARLAADGLLYAALLGAKGVFVTQSEAILELLMEMTQHEKQSSKG